MLPTTRLSITGSTWSPGVTAQSCSTRTRLSVTSRRNRSWYLQKKCAECALEGIVVKSRFRRPLDGGCHYFSILNVHVNYVCGALRSICFNLLLLIRSRCAQEGVTSLAGEFTEDAQRGKFGESSSLAGCFQPSSSVVAFVWQPFRAREHEVCRILSGIVNCRTPLASGSSRGWIPRLWV